jgi:uncharacterized integral membrane protein
MKINYIFFLVFLVLLVLLLLFLIPINDNDDDDDEKIDYSYYFLIFSIILILLIIFFKIILNERMIQFFYKYSFGGDFLRKIKNFLKYEKVELTESILKGGGNIDFNILPDSNWSGMSSLDDF